MTVGKSTAESVRAIVADRLLIDVAGDDVELIESGLIDSMSLVELFVALEEEFGVDVADGDLDLGDFRTITTIARLVDRLLASSP